MSVSVSPEDVTAEQLGLMHQLPDEEPRQPGRCRGCTALKRRSGPSVGHWPGSAGAPARQQWRRLTLRRRVSCCGVRRHDGQRKLKQAVDLNWTSRCETLNPNDFWSSEFSSGANMRLMNVILTSHNNRQMNNMRHAHSRLPHSHKLIVHLIVSDTSFFRFMMKHLQN